MIKSAGAKATSRGVILHLSKPVRALIKRFSLALLIIACLLGIFITKVDSPATRNARSTLSDVFAPVLAVVVSPVHMFYEIQDVIAEYFFVHSKNRQLLAQNTQLKSDLIMLRELQAQNQNLQELLGFVEQFSYQPITSRVIGDVSGPFIRSILINAGKSEGMAKGYAVIGERGLVGRVSEAGLISSRVLLITDINSRIPVVSATSRVRSIMSGDNSLQPKLDYLPEDHLLTEGEVMLTSGEGDLFPPDIPIGLVKRDKRRDAYVVVPFMRWHQLQNVSVLKYRHNDSVYIQANEKEAE